MCHYCNHFVCYVYWSQNKKKTTMESHQDLMLFTEWDPFALKLGKFPTKHFIWTRQTRPTSSSRVFRKILHYGSKVIHLFFAFLVFGFFLFLFLFFVPFVFSRQSRLFYSPSWSTFSSTFATRPHDTDNIAQIACLRLCRSSCNFCKLRNDCD